MIETEIGFQISTPHHLLFFGKAEASPETVRAAYKNFHFLRVLQTHGDQIKHWQNNSDPSSEADGHWTQLRNCALAISTADCIPILMVHSKNHSIMSLHAGWRGVASRIVSNGLNILTAAAVEAESVFVFIGPHIQQNSFEVHNDVASALLESVSQMDPSTREQIFLPNGLDKTNVDLNALVKMQLAEYNIPSDQIFDLHLDTFADSRFHSFRRDAQVSGRQWSFVVRI